MKKTKEKEKLVSTLTENQKKRGIVEIICPRCGAVYRSKYLHSVLACGRCGNTNFK